MSNIEVIYPGKWIEVVRDGKWEYVRRTKNVQAACVTALTHKKELVLIEEYRVPVQSKIIELPAGLVGDEVTGEDPHDCCLSGTHGRNRILINRCD